MNFLLHREVGQQIFNLGIASLLLNLRHGRRSFFAIAPHDDHGGALARQFTRRHFTDSARGAGDHTNFALQIMLLLRHWMNLSLFTVFPAYYSNEHSWI